MRGTRVPLGQWIRGGVESALCSFRPKYVQGYLSEFEYRSNRRFHLPELIPGFAYVAIRTPPMSEKLLEPSLA